MKNRIFIDMLAGIVELAGEREFVEEQLQKIFPLIEAKGLGSVHEDVQLNKTHISADETGDLGVNPKIKTKRNTKKPPKGQSCADRIRKLRSKGFFKERRSTSQIVDALGKEGWIYTVSQVSAAIGHMFKRSEIQRTKTGNSFDYYWNLEV